MKRSLYLICTALALSASVPTYAGSPGEVERQQLTLVLRQLDMLERTAAESRTLQSDGGRYHFDYQRFCTDIERIRAGVQDYLTPQRAQPRDPVEIIGHYLLEKDSP